MPNIAQHQSSETTKLLIMGDSSAGKTGSLCSLAAAGYNLRVIDVDNGLDVIHNLLTAPNSPYAKGTAERIEFETINDSMKQVGGRLVPVKASAWQRCVELLDNWKTDTQNFGNIGTWGPNDVLVIDTLSTLAMHALKFILALNMRLGQKPHQGDWYEAQMIVEGLLEKIADKSVRCNVIVNCHIKYIEDETTKIIKCFPEAAGKSLSPKIGRFFNNCVRAQTLGNKRVITTRSTNQLELKTSAPLSVKDTYPIETGLADLFKDLRGGIAPQVQK